jgi:phage baseplate assembly protein W
MPGPVPVPIYSDFDINFVPHPVTGDLLRVTGVNSVVQSVMNLVQLNHYDIGFHPEIGGNVRKLLFELADPTTANLLSEEIKNVITNFEPRAQVTTVDVQSTTNGDGYTVTINFYVLSIPNQLSISFFLERVR